MAGGFDEDDVVRDRKGRFKPGSRGNPNGAPRKERRTFLPGQHAKDFHGVFEAEITISVDGKNSKVPLAVAILNKLGEMAAKGNMGAAKLYFDQVGKIRKERSATIEAMTEWLDEWLREPDRKKIPDRVRGLMVEVSKHLEDAQYRVE